MGTDGQPEQGPRPAAVPPPARAPSVPALVARAVAVVALVGIAAVALPGRRGLEWDRLVRVPDVAWAQLLLGGIGAAVVLLALRQLLRLWRKLRPQRPDGPGMPEGVPMHWLNWVLAVAVTVGSMVGCYLLLRLLLDRVPESADKGPDAEDDLRSPAAGDGLLPVMLGLVAVLAVAVTVTLLLRRAAAPADDEPPAESADAVALSEAVVAAGQAMERYDDTRSAIIAAYREMARVLGPAAGRRPSDTPTELLERAVSAGLVSGAAARELTDLFREARFSRHTLPPATRHAAEAALARVWDELAVARV